MEDLIKSDRRVTLDEIATKLNISHGTVYAIVREKLHFSKVSCRWLKSVQNKRRGLQSRGVILLQDNARPHTASRTLAKIEDLGWKLLTHPPYSPDLAPSDFHLFGPLKESMKGIHFQTDEEVKAAVSNWLRTQSMEFYAKGIDNLISRWNECVAKEGDYVEK